MSLFLSVQNKLNINMFFFFSFVCFQVKPGQASRHHGGKQGQRVGDLLAVHGLHQRNVNAQRGHCFQHPGSSVQTALQVDQENLKKKKKRGKERHFRAGHRCMRSRE